MFAADDHAVHSPQALCSLWSTYTTQTHGSVRDTLPHTVVGVCGEFRRTGRFYPTMNLITMHFSTLRGTFCSLITLATPRQDWTGSNSSRREGGVCGFTLSRSHSKWAVRLVYTQISPGHIWTTLYLVINKCVTAVKVSNFSGHYLRNHSTLDIGVLGYIGIL